MAKSIPNGHAKSITQNLLQFNFSDVAAEERVMGNEGKSGGS
jgi:hypothetical protein